MEEARYQSNFNAILRTVFASQVKKIAGHIKNKYPGINVIIWDDMLRKWSPADMEESQLGHFVEPMVSEKYTQVSPQHKA